MKCKEIIKGVFLGIKDAFDNNFIESVVATERWKI